MLPVLMKSTTVELWVYMQILCVHACVYVCVSVEYMNVCVVRACAQESEWCFCRRVVLTIS